MTWPEAILFSVIVISIYGSFAFLGWVVTNAPEIPPAPKVDPPAWTSKTPWFADMDRKLKEMRDDAPGYVERARKENQ